MAYKQAGISVVRRSEGEVKGREGKEGKEERWQKE